jgi:hypothetical protein
VIAMGAWDRAPNTAGPTNGFVSLLAASHPGFSYLVSATTVAAASGSFGTGWTLPTTTQAWAGIVAAFKGQ